MLRTHHLTRRRAAEWSSPPRSVAPWSEPRESQLAAAAAQRSRHRQKATELLGRRAIRVVRPRRQPLDKNLQRSAQQDDVVELRMEPCLVLLAARDEKDVHVLGGQKCLDGVLPPHLTAVRMELNPPIVRVNGPVPAGDQLADDARLPGSRHPGEKDSLHDRGSVVAEASRQPPTRRADRPATVCGGAKRTPTPSTAPRAHPAVVMACRLLRKVGLRRRDSPTAPTTSGSVRLCDSCVYRARRIAGEPTRPRLDSSGCAVEPRRAGSRRRRSPRRSRRRRRS